MLGEKQRIDDAVQTPARREARDFGLRREMPLTGDAQATSATIRLGSSGTTPLTFSIDPPSPGLSVSPLSGTTRVTITVTAGPAQVAGPTTVTQAIQVRDKPDGAVIGYFHVQVDEISSDYVGVLAASPMSTLLPGRFSDFLAPGSLFYLGLDSFLPASSEPLSTDPAALVLTLAGYSFKLNNVSVPLQSHSNGTFVAQIPVELSPGIYTLEAFDAALRRVATAQLTLSAVAPQYLADSSNRLRARKTNGSIVDSGNPVQAGESILVTVTGQGAVTPPIATGLAASPGMASTPAVPVSATIGGEPATVLSSTMSISQTGVLEVWCQVPSLMTGDYDASISIGYHNAGVLPLSVTSAPTAPRILASGLANSASFAPRIAPGSLFSIFGAGLATGIQSAASFPLPTTMGQTSVTVGGIEAPLLYVSPEQINAQAPYELKPDPAAPVLVSLNGVRGVAATVPVVSAAPGIFQFGQNRAVVQNQDYSLNQDDNGASPGSYLMIYLTGSGEVNNPVGTGMAAPIMPFSTVRGTVTATVNGVPADVAFAGLAPGFAGLTQVNIRVPNLPAGTYPIMVSVDGNWSNSALVTVQR